MMISRKKLPVLLANSIAFLWMASLFLPAVRPTQDQLMWGWHVLFMGWLGVFAIQFAWLANLLIIPAVVMIASPKPRGFSSKLVGGALLLLALNALFWRDMYYDSGPRPIQAYHIGYYCWIIAMISAGTLLISRGSSFDRVWNSH